MPEGNLPQELLCSDMFADGFLEHVFNTYALCRLSLPRCMSLMWMKMLTMFALPKPLQLVGSSENTAAASMHGSKKSKGGRGSVCAKPAGTYAR